MSARTFALGLAYGLAVGIFADTILTALEHAIGGAKTKAKP